MPPMAPKRAAQRPATRSERRRAAVQQRRRLAGGRSAAARRAAARRRWLRGLAVVAVLAAGGGALAYFSSRDDGPSRQLRAERVDGVVGPLGISRVPESYRAVYRAEGYDGSAVTVSTEEITVQRPFDGRVFIREGEPPGGAVQFEGRSTFATYANYTGSGPAQVAGDAPSVALGDLRLGHILDELVARDLFVPGERRRLMLPDGAGGEGRQCQAYRTGSSLQSLTVSAPTDENYTEACIDGAGLLLEEVTVVDGEVSQRLTATELELDLEVDPAIFTIEGERLGPEQGGAEVTEVDPAVAPVAGYWALDTVPDGFEHRGRYLVEGQASSHVDVYVRGVDLLTVRQGAPAAEPDESGTTGRDVDLGPLGPGRLIPGTTGSKVVAHPGDEWFVHVSGTLAPAQLEALASALRRS